MTMRNDMRWIAGPAVEPRRGLAVLVRARTTLRVLRSTLVSGGASMLLGGRRILRHALFEVVAHSVAITGVFLALFVVAYRSGGALTAVALMGATGGLAVVVGAVAMLLRYYANRDADPAPGSVVAAAAGLMGDHHESVRPCDRGLRRQEEPAR